MLNADAGLNASDFRAGERTFQLLVQVLGRAGRKDKSELFKITENALAIGNFGGFPSLTLPIGLDNNFPYGANLTCKPFDEVTLFALSSAIEEDTNLKDLTVRKVGL